MRLINVETLELESFDDHQTTPRYAVLSHTWGEDEVLFQDVHPVTETTKEKSGWKKIEYTCKQAKKDNLKYAWVDTCCIDKSSSAELSEAINSMYAWYQESKRCYAYLADVNKPRKQLAATLADVPRYHAANDVAFVDEHSIVASVHLDAHNAACFERQTHVEAPAKDIDPAGVAIRTEEFQDCAATGKKISPLYDGRGSTGLSGELVADRFSDSGEAPLWEQFKASRWFTRGWTLQELLAPRHFRFYSFEWKRLGSLRHLVATVSDITRIPCSLLLQQRAITEYCAARRMSWAALVEPLA